jgi:type VI secretion system secreted protein Hcp
MAVQSEILVTDSDGSTVQGERENGSSFVHEFKFTINKPSEISGSMHTGIRRVDVFWLVKDIDRLSPPLLDALTNNKELQEIKVTLYRIGLESGEHEPFFQYKLTGARIVSVENWMPFVHDPETAAMPNMEKIGMVAREFSITHLIHNMESIIQTYGVE